MDNSFLHQIANCLTDHLPPEARHAKMQVYPAKGSLRLYYPEFESSYYELCLKPAGAPRFLEGNEGLKSDKVVEIGFHFAGGKSLRSSRLAMFETHLPSVQPNLEQPLTVADGSRVVMRLAQGPATETAAKQYAGLMGRFLDQTYPLLRRIFETIPARSKQARPSEPALNPNHYGPYAILSRQIDHIHAFLQGRANRPSDDKLCDWVQLCYTFELYQEGADLFKLIDQTAVQSWLYDRARRLAKACRMRARS